MRWHFSGQSWEWSEGSVAIKVKGRVPSKELRERIRLCNLSSRLVNIEVSSIGDTLSPILFKYRWSYHQYL